MSQNLVSCETPISEEVVHASLLVILQRHVIAFLQSRQYWNKVAPTSFQARKG